MEGPGWWFPAAPMVWTHPLVLWLLPALGAAAALYGRTLGRRRVREVVRFPAWPIAAAAAHGGAARRHLPAALFLAGLGAAVVGAAGPVALWPAPTGWPVVLLIDVSRSMEESDIAPSRIEAAKAAALEFLRGLPRSTKVALVSFGNYAAVVVPLTPDRGRLEEGIRGLSLQLRTQLGNGLVEAVRAVAGDADASPGPDRPRAIAVLLTDGRASDGVPPLDAARDARRHGVRVYTVGVGTVTDPARLRSGYWGVLDEPTLRAIAQETGGRYFRAAEAGGLRNVYRDLARAVGWERRPQELSAAAAVAAAALLTASTVLRVWSSPLH